MASVIVPGSNLIPDFIADAVGRLPPVQPSSGQGSVALASDATSSDLLGISSTWGKTIPLLFGTCQVLGLPLWTGNASYITNTDGTTDLVCDFAVVFGRAGPNGTGASIRNIYFDGVPTVGVDPATGQLAISQDLSYNFHDGTQAATDVDPLIDSVEAPYTPAFLGLIYIVFEQYQVTGTNFPQVIAEIHLDEITSPSGALIEPMDYNNTKVASKQYDFPWWDYNAGLLFLWRHFPFGYTGETDIVDVYDTNGKQFLYTIHLSYNPGSLDPAGAEWSPIDQSLYIATGGILLMYDSNGNFLSQCTLTGSFYEQDISVQKGVFECDEILIVPMFSGTFSIVERSGSVVTTTDQFSWPSPHNTAVAGPAAGILDYTTIPFDTSLFTIVYTCIAGGIGRIIKTNGNQSVPVGVAYSKESSGRFQSKGYNKTTEIQVIKSFSDGSTPFQIFVDDDGRRVYILIYNNTAACYQIQAYDTFYSEFNKTTNPKKATKPQSQIDSEGGFEFFNLAYERKFVPSYSPTGNKANQIRKLGQYTVCLPAGFGQEIIKFDLRSGTAQNHPQGDWIQLPALGGFDYGNQAFNATSIYDADSNAVFYQAMSTYDDLPGRAYLASPIPGTRPTYRIGDAFRDLSLLVGFTSDQISISGLTNTSDVVTGMALNQNVGYADLISQLAATFRVDVLEDPTNFGIIFTKRQTIAYDFAVVPGDVIPTNDNGDLVALARAATSQLPDTLQLSYVDPDQQYLVAVQSARRQTYPQVTAQGNTIVLLSIPIVMTAIQAAYYVGYALYDMWAGALQLTLNLPPVFALAQCGDYATVQLRTGRIITCKVASMQYNSDFSVTMVLSAIQVNHFVPKGQITGPKTS